MNVKSIVEQANGRIFTVTFKKKNGEVRKMNCRTGVTKHLRGGDKTTPEKYITVYDVQNKGYRCFDPETVLAIKSNGRLYVG